MKHDTKSLGWPKGNMKIWGSNKEKFKRINFHESMLIKKQNASFLLIIVAIIGIRESLVEVNHGGKCASGLGLEVHLGAVQPEKEACGLGHTPNSKTSNPKP